MATTTYCDILNNIDKIQVESTNQTTSEIEIIKFNDKIKYNDNLYPSTVDSKIKTFFNNLSTNVYKASLVTMTQDISQKITVPTFTESEIKLPATTTNITKNLTCSDIIDNVFCVALYANNQTVYFTTASSPSDANGYPRRLKIDNEFKGVTMNFATSGYTGGGSLVLRCYFMKNYYYNYYFNLKLQS